MASEKVKKDDSAPLPVPVKTEPVRVLVAVEMFVDVATQRDFRVGQPVFGWSPERIKLYLDRGLVRYEEQLLPNVEVK